MTLLVSQWITNNKFCRGVQGRGHGPVLNNILRFAWNEWGNHKVSVRIFSLPADFQIGFLPNTGRRRHPTCSVRYNVTVPQQSVIPQSHVCRWVQWLSLMTNPFGWNYKTRLGPRIICPFDMKKSAFNMLRVKHFDHQTNWITHSSFWVQRNSHN
jgi:hypothetical protein